MQPGYQQYPPPLKKKRPKWPWVLLGAGAVLVIAVCFGVIALAGAVGESVDNRIEHGNTELQSHVKLDECKTNQLGFVDITYTVTNSTDANQSYLIQFAINDSKGNRLSEAHGAVNNLAPGKTAAKQKTLGGEVTGKFVCMVERVN